MNQIIEFYKGSLKDREGEIFVEKSSVLDPKRSLTPQASFEMTLEGRYDYPVGRALSITKSRQLSSRLTQDGAFVDKGSALQTKVFHDAAFFRMALRGKQFLYEMEDGYPEPSPQSSHFEREREIFVNRGLCWS